jgi:hypothetical protein
LINVSISYNLLPQKVQLSYAKPFRHGRWRTPTSRQKALAERLAANTCGGIRHVLLFPLSARPVLAIKFEGDHFQQ